MDESKMVVVGEGKLDELLKGIKRIEEEIHNLKVDKTTNNFSDSFEREEAIRRIDSLSALLAKKRAQLANVIIVSKGEDSAIVDLDDYALIELSVVGSSRVKTEIIRLTGSLMPANTDEVTEVTFNSPLGKAVYRKREGESFKYKVNDKEVHGVVKFKASTLEEIMKKKNTVRR